MRLLMCDQNGELSLTNDLSDGVPPYAILSHTWSKDSSEEVTFNDIENNVWKDKTAYRKIQFCAEQARHDGLQYFWVDTCCINRSTMDEVQESINSMFRWYSDAAQCYVYLSDVSMTTGYPQNGSHVDSHQVNPFWRAAFRKSKWWSRGWTLQELLAPTSVQFFSREGIHLGDKGSLEQEIHNITNIPVPALRRTTPFDQFDADERLRWAEMRQTTREEDWAYCLLGILGVFMPVNYGEGRGNAIQRLRKEITNTPQRQEWLRKLYSCPYRDRKDRNPPRVEGTCEWFMNHSLFQNWHQSHAASLLWVSADPGCGKSVLAKYLADTAFPITVMRTTCYFFFKEDFEDQRSSIIALCSILHQIFDHQPATFSNEIFERFQDKGATLLTSFGDLWDILISATTAHKRRRFVCILDALDECETVGRNQLIDAIIKFPSHKTTENPALKFILTSRPYLDIKRRFRDLEHDIPTIHLQGENEEEITKISREIDMVIKARVADMSRTLELSKEKQTVLVEELTRVPSRTYLWAYLIFDEVQNAILLTPGKIRSVVRSIPQTVSEAYEKILMKSRDINLARKLLHIVIAAARPLTLREMALALAINPKHQSMDDLVLVSEEQFHDDIRQLCGLFLVVVDFKIYLLHQTAREFLVPPPSRSSPPLSSTPVLQWEYSFHQKESHRILAEICIQRLFLLDFNISDLSTSANHDQYLDMRTFLQYAVQYWADHFRQGDWNDEDWAVEKATLYCRPDLPTSAWYEIYQKVARRPAPGSFTSLLVASYFGLNIVVKRLPKKVWKDVNLKDSKYGRSAVSWAAGEGYSAMVQNLLSGSTLKRLLGIGAHINTKDYHGRTPLHRASEEGRHTAVQQLLNAHADLNPKDDFGRTPLHWASENGHDIVMRQLIKAGADPDARDDYGRTPLHRASENGRDTVVQQLIKAGADLNAKGDSDRTPLHWASENGHDAAIQQLLEAGADPNAKDKSGRMPLYGACENGHDTAVQQLLKAGADPNAKDHASWAPLHGASQKGYGAVIQRLLGGGANPNAKDDYGKTPLYVASMMGHDAVVHQLLGSGAEQLIKLRQGY